MVCGRLRRRLIPCMLALTAMLHPMRGQVSQRSMAMDVDSGRGSETGGAIGGDGTVPLSPGAGSVRSVGSSRRASTVGGSLSHRSRSAPHLLLLVSLMPRNMTSAT